MTVPASPAVQWEPGLQHGALPKTAEQWDAEGQCPENQARAGLVGEGLHPYFGLLLHSASKLCVPDFCLSGLSTIFHCYPGLTDSMCHNSFFHSALEGLWPFPTSANCNRAAVSRAPRPRLLGPTAIPLGHIPQEQADCQLWHMCVTTEPHLHTFSLPVALFIFLSVWNSVCVLQQG